MTPKEKATELFNAMKGFRVKHTHSKKCARICVEQIIENSSQILDGIDYYVELNYWEEVKEEIEKI